MRQHLTLFLFFLFLGIEITPAQTKINIDGVPRDTSFTVYQTFLKERKKFPEIEIASASLPENVIEYKELVYKKINENRSLKLNLYSPNDNQKHPALVMIHGGGWSSGDYSLQIPMAMQIASEGYVTIPIEYRLSPEAPYPAAIYDIKSAIKWIRENADKYQIDSDRIVISGCSAGGHLAHLCGATNGISSYEDPEDNSDCSADVQAVINIDGISDFISEEKVTRAQAYKEQGKVSVDMLFLGGTYEEVPEVWIAASPLFQLSKHSAPVCFINSNLPKFRYGRDEAIKKMNELNIYTEVHLIPDTPHPFWLFHPWFSTNIEYMLQFLDNWIDSQQALKVRSTTQKCRNALK